MLYLTEAILWIALSFYKLILSSDQMLRWKKFTGSKELNGTPRGNIYSSNMDFSFQITVCSKITSDVTHSPPVDVGKQNTTQAVSEKQLAELDSIELG